MREKTTTLIAGQVACRSQPSSEISSHLAPAPPRSQYVTLSIHLPFPSPTHHKHRTTPQNQPPQSPNCLTSQTLQYITSPNYHYPIEHAGTALQPRSFPFPEQTWQKQREGLRKEKYTNKESASSITHLTRVIRAKYMGNGKPWSCWRGGWFTRRDVLRKERSCFLVFFLINRVFGLK